MSLLDAEAIHAAARRIQPHVHRTPVITSQSVDDRCGSRIFFKCEHFQKTGSFKARGACNAVFSLSDTDARRGVVTHSSGNHAAALAMAAKKRGINAHIVMPDNAPKVKQAAVKHYGGSIHFCAPNLKAREMLTEEITADTGAVLIHPSNDLRIMAGQGTAALELLGQAPDLDGVLAPVGGGGLLSGTAVAVKSLAGHTRVVGVEPAGADDACRSLKAGRIIQMQAPDSIADGLLTSLGDLTFAVIQHQVDEILTVTDAEIISAMRFVWERLKLVIEPSAAVPVAAVLEKKVDVVGRRIGVILSGGNVDLETLPWRANKLKPKG